MRGAGWVDLDGVFCYRRKIRRAFRTRPQNGPWRVPRQRNWHPGWWRCPQNWRLRGRRTRFSDNFFDFWLLQSNRKQFRRVAKRSTQVSYSIFKGLCAPRMLSGDFFHICRSGRQLRPAAGHSTAGATCRLHHCDRVCFLSRIVLAKSCSAVDPPRKTQTCLSRHLATDLKPLCASCSLDHAVRRRKGWGKSRVDLKLLRLPAEGGSHAPKISSRGCAPPPRSQVGEAEGLG